MELNYAYITTKQFPDGEFVVSGRKADGSLLFGFRTRDYWGIRQKAALYTPSSYIPVWGSRVAGLL